MNMLNKFLIVMVFFVCSCEVIYAQEVNYLEQAYELYGVGKYEQAQKALNMYSFMTGSQDKTLEERIRYCLNSLTLAREAELAGEYTTAKLYYEVILKCNPKDSIVGEKIKGLLTKISSQDTDERTNNKTHEKDMTSLFVPQKIGYNFQILSSFDKKGLFGLAVNFNRAYFQLGFDLILSGISESVIHKQFSFQETLSTNYFELSKNTVNASDGESWKEECEYIRPIMQFAINPGFNINVLSISCGLGGFMNKHLTMNHYLRSTTGKSEYDDMVENTKVYFMIRPTISGYIKGRNSGFVASIGYNYVPKAKLLNSIVLGIGFSW